MFRKMRRFKQQLSNDETIALLKSSTSGVLALCGDDEYTYAVPLSYVYNDGKIYFHWSITGHKLDALKNNNKVSFCVIANEEVIPDKMTTHYKSVIAFGKAKIIEGDAANKAIDLLMRRYSPNSTDEKRANHIKEAENHIKVIEMNIEHITGKQSL